MAAPATDRDAKRLLRAVVRQVHPDLFSAHPAERAANAEALARLNAYADALAAGERPAPARLEFWARRDGDGDGDGGGFARLAAELGPEGSLAPLLLAFGLITPEEAAADAAAAGAGAAGRDLFTWLSGTVADAVAAAGAHGSQKRAIDAARAEVEAAHGLAAVSLGAEFSVSGEEQARALAALRVLGAALRRAAAADPEWAAGLAGVRVRLYHPADAPLATVSYVDRDGALCVRSEPSWARVAEDGTLHVVADAGALDEQLAALDLGRARLLARVAAFWARRARDLQGALAAALGVRQVWVDGRADDGPQRFVLWAGALLEAAAGGDGAAGDDAAAIAGAAFPFSLLVHSDAASPMLEYGASAGVLQVRSDCPPRRLLAFLAGEAGAAASTAAARIEGARAAEDALLAAVRDALGARAVVRLCPSSDGGAVAGAARRLLAAAPELRAALPDLGAVSLAIDEVYELWDSGFISIPHDFAVGDLQPRLRALLAGGAAVHPAAGGAAEAAAAGGGAAAARAAAPPRPRARPGAPPPPPRRALGAARPARAAGARCARAAVGRLRLA